MQIVVANTSKIKISKAIHNEVENTGEAQQVVANTSKIKISKAIHNFKDLLHYLKAIPSPFFFTPEQQYVVLS